MSNLLPNYLRTYRKRSALAQHELAVLLGSAHESKVSRYERGRRVPTLPTLIAYEIVFRVGLRHLFAGEYERIRKHVRRRARALSRAVDAKLPWTPALQRKFDFLASLINPNHPHTP